MTSPQCSLGWPDTPEAQGLTSSPPWPGPEPAFLLGLLLIPSKSLKACSPPSAPPWPVQPPLPRVVAYTGPVCTNAKLHIKASANLGGQCHLQLNSNQHQTLLPYRKEDSLLENLTKFSTSVKHPDTSLMASALLPLGGQDRLLVEGWSNQ